MSQEKNAGLTTPQTLTSLVVVLLFGIGLLSYHLFHEGDQSNISNTKFGSVAAPAETAPSSNAPANPYVALSPATVPSKAPECSQQITYSASGVVSPLTCTNGDLNVLAWNSLATLEPSVMSLGYGASSSQVQAALCSDVHANISNPIEEVSYQISALYYGWNFTTNPSAVINNGTCVNVDD